MATYRPNTSRPLRFEKHLVLVLVHGGTRAKLVVDVGVMKIGVQTTWPKDSNPSITVSDSRPRINEKVWDQSDI
jgi:hypothetical protein